MARTKKTEKAAPKGAEIISLASLRAKRDAKRADVRVTTYVLTGEGVNAGDIVLCLLKDNTHALASVESKDEDTGKYHLHRGNRSGEVAGVIGRVVTVEFG